MCGKCTFRRLGLRYGVGEEVPRQDVVTTRVKQRSSQSVQGTLKDISISTVNVYLCQNKKESLDVQKI